MASQTKHRELYPSIKPFKEEYLDVSDVYALARPVCGNRALILSNLPECSKDISYTSLSTANRTVSLSCFCMEGELHFDA
jgi:hypothetical protein